MNALQIVKEFFRLLRKYHLLNIFLNGFAYLYYFRFKLLNNLKIINLKYLPPRNRPRYILVANHSSGADAYIMLGCMTGRFYRRSYAVVHEKEFRKDNLARVFLEAFDMIPRFGTGQQVIKKMAEHLLQNKTITIVPEGMTSDKIMKGYTGVMRLYYMINKLPSIHNTIPILPVVTIGANKAYPIKADPDGKYRTHKVGIIIRLGKPIYYQLPEHPTPEWFRQKTDELMDHIAHMALQKEGVIDSWKQNQLTRQKPREYHQ